MSQCVGIDSSGFLVQSTNCDYVLLTQAEFTALNVENFLAALDSYFVFDSTLASQIIGSFLVTFVVSHGLGRVVRIMGKNS